MASTIAPYVVDADATVTTGGEPMTRYSLAYPNTGGVYRVTARRLYDGRWSLSANGKAEGIFPREPSAATVCDWFNTAPPRAGMPVIDMSPARR